MDGWMDVDGWMDGWMRMKCQYELFTGGAMDLPAMMDNFCSIDIWTKGYFEMHCTHTSC